MASPSRRQFLQAASVSTVAAVGGCVTLAQKATDHPVREPVTSWSSFRGDRHNTGFAKNVPPTSSDPEIEWTFETGDAIWGSPAVVDGAVYVGSADHSLYAVDAATGAKRWEFSTGHRIEGTPAYGDDTVYVGSYDGRVYAVDAATGELRWKRELDGIVRGSPVVVGGAVYVGAGCHNLACSWYAEDEASKEGVIYSLDAETGDVRWRREVDDEVVSTPAVDGETVYVGSSDESMYALDATDGDVKWIYEADDMIWSSPAVAFGTVYFGDWDGLVHAVDAASGEEVWTFDTGAHYISGSVAVDEEAVYVGMTPRNFPEPGIIYAEIFGLDRVSGAERWRFETNSTEVGSSPVVADDRLYIGTHQPSETDGNGVYALTTDGEEEWFLDVDARGVGSSPTLLDGTLYFGGTDGSLYAIA